MCVLCEGLTTSKVSKYSIECAEDRSSVSATANHFMYSCQSIAMDALTFTCVPKLEDTKAEQDNVEDFRRSKRNRHNAES